MKGIDWELIGTVSVSDSGTVDNPLTKYRKKVWPRACKMGGQAIAVLEASTEEDRSQIGIHTGESSYVVFGVLRKSH